MQFSGPPFTVHETKLGYSVALDSDRMAVGMTGGWDPDLFGSQPGAVRIFDRVGASWLETQTIQASDGEPGDNDDFGVSVALDGDTLLVGAISHGLLDAQGSAFVFERQASGEWLETQILLPPEFDTWVMGSAVDLEGDRAAIGARSGLGSGKGKVFIYERVDGLWTKTATLQPPAPFSLSGDRFGYSLDLEGDRVLVGAPFHPLGVAFTFTYSQGDGQWHHEGFLASPDLTETDSYGYDVTLDGTKALVGAPLHDLPLFNAGAVYAFDLLAGIWTLTGKLTSSDFPSGTDLFLFGSAIDLVGDRALLGAQYGGTESAGICYEFVRSGGVWSEVAKIQGSSLVDGDTFGFAIAMHGSEAAIGAPNVVADTLGPGKVFLYSFSALDGGASLIADATELSLSQGGSQSLSIAGCAEHAGDFYALAGSLSGTAPGFAFGGFSVALNPDPYFFFTLSSPPGTPLAAAQGFLDAFGRADASFALPPNSSPALAGLVANHAVALFDPLSLALQALSAPVPVALVP